MVTFTAFMPFIPFSSSKETGKKGIEFAYVDHFGNLTDTPPDPSQKFKVDIESIEVSVPKTLDSDRVELNPVRTGTVSFFDTSKGFGFIVDGENQEKYFCHVSGLVDEITEGNRVSFELEKGMKGNQTQSYLNYHYQQRQYLFYHHWHHN